MVTENIRSESFDISNLLRVKENELKPRDYWSYEWEL